MKYLFSVIFIFCLFAVTAHATGLQNGRFRCQATQGKWWEGTATIVEESFNITVLADYLDVELDWVIEVGGTEPDSFQNALEIVGNINLVDKSVVVGLLTWFNGMTLKGKLKTSEVAREQYEDVVQRDTTIKPPPRDPVLLERIRDDNYDISIFPVTFGETRHVRIRYLIPAFLVNGVNKVAYPHAFSGNAEVFIKKGDGVREFKVETYTSQVHYDNHNFLALSSAEYTFKAYGAGHAARINYIIPVISDKAGGSRFYTGDFSTGLFGGQMAHVTVMSGEEALQYTDLPEDYVILWRWNHPQILAKYARQIVAQSKLLQAFLESLDAANKRAALVIDKEGGERIIFRLDRKGSVEWDRMMAYLASLSAQAVTDPPMRNTPRGSYAFDVQKAFEEFRHALIAAAAQFDEKSGALKHLLIICAGPKLVSGYVADQNVDWDGEINVSLLHSYFRSSGHSAADLGSASYWPGVNVDMFMNTHKANFRMTATVGNGTDTHSIEVQSPSQPPEQKGYTCVKTGTREMHLFSSPALVREIKWTVYQGDMVLSEFTEKPQIVSLKDGMQYARVIGGSPHLFPMAESMPSSMASTLGFVDDEYSLVALEEDILPGVEAELYARAGVPLLKPDDIFAANDEIPDMPVDDWLAANRPEPMNKSVCHYYPYYYPMSGGDTVFYSIGLSMVSRSDAMSFDWASAPMILVNTAPALLPIPSASTINATDPEAYIDWDAPIAVESAGPPAPQKGSIACYVTGRHLVINLAGFSLRARDRMELTLYDVSGRVVKRWRGSILSSRLVRWNMGNAVSGLYVVSIKIGNVRVNKKVVLVR
jgi:hypothetical protein